MYYVTGDIHGNICNLLFLTEELTKKDVLIILGDVGFNYYRNKKDEAFKKEANEIGITLFCIRGNHELYPCYINSYQTKQWNGGTVYYEEEYPNLLFPKDGEIFTFNKKRCVVIGGAYSIDKEYRKMNGWQWFEEEQLTMEEMDYVEENLARNNWKVDYVLSHTCPISTCPTFLFHPAVDQTTVDKTMEKWLQTIADRLDFKKWYFGHYHGNWNNGKYCMLFEKVQNLTESELPLS